MTVPCSHYKCTFDLQHPRWEMGIYISAHHLQIKTCTNYYQFYLLAAQLWLIADHETKTHRPAPVSMLSPWKLVQVNNTIEIRGSWTSLLIQSQARTQYNSNTTGVKHHHEFKEALSTRLYNWSHEMSQIPSWIWIQINSIGFDNWILQSHEFMYT
jgi:hypothetical protein